MSAGPLATERPLWFVVAGLWGVGGLCLLGALLAWLLARSGLRGVPALLARWLGRGVGALLLARGIGVEVLLLIDTTPLDTAVSAGQRAWTLALWNPWFIAGGLAFGLATLRSRRPTGGIGAGKKIVGRKRTSSPPRSDPSPPCWSLQSACWTPSPDPAPGPGRRTTPASAGFG